MKQTRLTNQQKEQLMQHASENLTVLDLKSKLKIDASYDRIRVFLTANDLPYKLRGTNQQPKTGVHIPDGYFNVESISKYETWLV